MKETTKQNQEDFPTEISEFYIFQRYEAISDYPIKSKDQKTE